MIEAIKEVACRQMLIPGTGAFRCGKKAVRAGAQDGCDIYVCEDRHITRIRLDEPRKEWSGEWEER